VTPFANRPVTRTEAAAPVAAIAATIGAASGIASTRRARIDQIRRHYGLIEVDRG
jgi:hypothetical protein